MGDARPLWLVDLDLDEVRHWLTQPLDEDSRTAMLASADELLDERLEVTRSVGVVGVVEVKPKS